jgi:hypothetical protein
VERQYRKFQKVLYGTLTQSESPIIDFRLSAGTLAAVTSIAAAYPDAIPRHIVIAYDTFHQENI